MKLTEFQTFLRCYGGRFPYSDVRKTRRTFHVKWLLLGDSGTHVAIPSSCVDSETQNHSIITLQAVPATQEMEGIIEYMERWGRVEDPVWHRKVLNWLVYICQQGIKRPHMSIVYDCIVVKIRHVLNEHLGTRYALTGRIMNNWHDLYVRKWNSGVKDFAVLKQYSIEYVFGKIQSASPSSPSTVASLR